MLRDKLATLTWLERLGGVVVNAVKPKYVTGADGAQIKTGEEVYPVACDTTDADCWNNGKYKFFMPDSSVSAVGFFKDTGGVSVQSVQESNSRLRMAFELQFLCWLNLKKLGLTDCEWTGVAIPYVVSKLWGEHGEVQDVYQQVSVSRIRQMPKTPSIFQPYTFAEAEKRGLFLYPYDYFGLVISGTFDVNVACLPTLTLPGSEIECLPE